MLPEEELVLLQQLHEDYYHSTVDKTKLNLRNAIMTALIPELEQTVNRFNSINTATREDIFQIIVEKTLVVHIPKWKPTGKSILAYYQTCFFRTGLNALKIDKRVKDREVLVDPLSYYWNISKLEAQDSSMFENKFVFSDEIKQEIYMRLLDVMQDDGLEGGKEAFFDVLMQEYPITRAELKRVHVHALITCRENYKEKISSSVQKIDTESFFGRLSLYLTEAQIHDVIKVFGGVKIKIPTWVERES